MNSKSSHLKNYIICLLAKQHFDSEQDKEQFNQKIKNLWLQLYRIHEQLIKLNPKSDHQISHDSLEIISLMRQIQNRLKVLPMETVRENKRYSTTHRLTIMVAIASM